MFNDLIIIGNSITLAFSSRGLYDNTYNDGLIITSGPNSLTVSLQSTIQENKTDPTISGTAQLKASLDSLLNPPTLIPNRKLTVKNIGTGTAKNISIVVPAEYVIRINRCPTNLNPGVSCDIDVTLRSFRTSSTATPGLATISSGSEHVSINLFNNDPLIHDPISCIVDHGTGLKIYQVSAYGPCMVNSYDPGYYENNSSCAEVGTSYYSITPKSRASCPINSNTSTNVSASIPHP